MQNFDLNLLRALDALLTEKNVTRAADKVFVTQSTMSGMLGRLRDQFSDRLLIRSGRRYDLSPLAQSLAISVRQTLLQIEATISAKPLFDPKTDRRSFKIMASDYATITYLSEVFRRIARSAPLLGFEVVPIDSPLDSVRNGNVDLCVTGNPEIKINNHPDQLLRHDILFSEVYCCVVDQHHPLNGRLSIDSYFKFPSSLPSSPASQWQPADGPGVERIEAEHRDHGAHFFGDPKPRDRNTIDRRDPEADGERLARQHHAGAGAALRRAVLHRATDMALALRLRSGVLLAAQPHARRSRETARVLNRLQLLAIDNKPYGTTPFAHDEAPRDAQGEPVVEPQLKHRDGHPQAVAGRAKRGMRLPRPCRGRSREIPVHAQSQLHAARGVL